MSVRVHCTGEKSYPSLTEPSYGEDMAPNRPFRDGYGFMDYHHGGPGALGWTVFALQLLAIAGIAWLLVSLLLGRAGRRATPVAVPAGPAASGPLETLHMRYARGEIGRDEYLQARADLSGEPLPPSDQPTQP